MDLKIKRLDANNLRIQGEIRIEFSRVEKTFQMYSLIREFSEYKSKLKILGLTNAYLLIQNSTKTIFGFFESLTNTLNIQYNNLLNSINMNITF